MANTTPTVCIIGAGFSGLCAAIQLKKQLGIDSYEIFESREDVGGTWLANKYPGASCDVPIHLYSFSFQQNPNWSTAYGSQPQILEYMRSVAKKYEIYPRIQFRTAVRVLRWDEELSKWRVRICKDGSDEQELTFDIIINGCGHLRIPNIPKEFASFQGKVMHSAEWDPATSLKDKTVAVVGSGASAIQIIPAIAPVVGKLHVFQRRPAWILPKPEVTFSGFIQRIFTIFPCLMWILRLAVFCLFESMTLFFVHQGRFSKIGAWLATRHREGSMPGMSPELSSKLSPSYSYGCKRISISSDYYPTLCRGNVALCSEPITQVRGNSIRTKNETFDNIDVLVLATGFKVQDYFAPMEIIGKSGINLLESWRLNGPAMFYGVVCKEAPNFFTLGGPSSYLASNSIIFQIECQTNMIMKIIRELLARDSKFVCLKPAAEAEYMKRIRKNLEGKVWANEECGSWYANSKGEVTSLWPQTCTSFWLQLRRVDHRQFDFS